MKACRFHIICFIVLFAPAAVPAQKMQVKLENQASGWATAGFTDPFTWQVGARYIPTLSLIDSLAKEQLLDVEISGNVWGNALFSGAQYESGDASLKPYRFWIRYAIPRMEFRIGLQKISFGSATILRPLMWFDRIDFRDPLQLTEGVYAFLGRYYFRNNANLWFWTLYGNDDPMGWEAVPTQKHKPEFGGRFQFPIPRGEAGVTYHFRNAEFIPPSDTLFSPYPASYPENRMGLDGKWDLGVGLWFEGVVKHNRVAHDIIPEWQAYCNLGMDYTFPFGTGLNLTLEYFRHDSRNNHTEESSHTNFLVMAANYPVGILSNLSAMVYYSVEMQDWYRFINLQRKYDYWSFYLMVFWNPERFTMFMSESGRNLYAGKGMQLMAVVNF